MRDLTMTDNRHRTRDTTAGMRAPHDAAERALLRDAERIAAEVAAMSSEEVADYLIEHDLQDLVAPARIDALLVRAREQVLRRRERDGTPSADPLAVQAVVESLRRSASEDAVNREPKASGMVGDAPTR